jgi:hypothetical protein
MKPRRADFRTWASIFSVLVAVASAAPAMSAATKKGPTDAGVSAPTDQTVGGGAVARPAAGPPPACGVGGNGFVLVKNWDFGTRGTVRNIGEMNAEFQYHDQFGTYCCGGHYGAVIVAPDKAHAIGKQPIEDPKHPVREFLADSLRTYLVPPAGADSVKASDHEVGSGSFQAKWTLSRGGKLLGQDILFETRVRYVTPPYFWFAIWTSGNKWSKGAEMDVIESFGFDNGGGSTNFDGRLWHSDPVGGTATTHYKNWPKAMKERGVLSEANPRFNAAEYHTWTWLYRADDTYSSYVDGIEVQSGILHWTLSGKEGGEPLNMSFLFDGTWGHSRIPSVNKPLPASELAGKYYEWKHSRIYLRDTGQTP